MSRLTRDGPVEPVSRDRILSRRERGHREIFVFPVQLTTSSIGNHPRLIHTLELYIYICDDHDGDYARSVQYITAGFSPIVYR